MSWATTEFKTLNLGDQRRNQRAIKMMKRFSAKPPASILQAGGGWADTMAAYRFFENDAFGWCDILQPHIVSTEREPLGVLDAWS